MRKHALFYGGALCKALPILPAGKAESQELCDNKFVVGSPGVLMPLATLPTAFSVPNVCTTTGQTTIDTSNTPVTLNGAPISNMLPDHQQLSTQRTAGDSNRRTSNKHGRCARSTTSGLNNRHTHIDTSYLATESTTFKEST